MKDYGRIISRCVSILLAGTLAGCGGSSDSADPGPEPTPSATAQTTIGMITGFGSVYVNGVEYDTAGASYDVDDVSASNDDALAVGMVVAIQGSVNADGRTGTAESVSYDDDVEGIVENLAIDAMDTNVLTFSVMGISVRADRTSTNFDGEDDPAFSFDTVANGDNVEVSGEYDGDLLVASYIEKQHMDDDDYEAKGTVDQYNGSDQFVLVLRNTSTLNITLADSARIPTVGIADGQFVEVEGTIPDPVNAPTDLLATKVELEDDDRIESDDDDEIEIKGDLSYDAETGAWSIRDVVLAFSESTEYKPESLANSIADMTAAGLNVEVEGEYVNDVLQVEEIELEEGEHEEGELEFKADASSVTVMAPREGSITLTFGNATGSVDIIVTTDTMFRDDESMSHFDLNSLVEGTKIEVDARRADDGMIYATSLHLEDDIGYEIEGPLDSIDTDVSITVLGIAFGLDANTFYENGVPVAGDEVEVSDENGDGIADKVEIED